MVAPLDHLDIEQFSPVGDAPLLVLEAGDGAQRYREAQALVIGVDRAGKLPRIDERDFDVLLSGIL